MRRTALLLLLSALLGASAASAQTAPKPPAKASFFRQVIPQPTGKNGYEELVLAAETFRNSRHYAAVQRMEGLTLETKRALLDDKQVARALQLLRQGLQKPVFQPRQELTFATLLPELGPIRDLAKLLAIQQYVYLADGRTSEALGIARLGIRLGRAVQMDTLVAGLVGIAMSTLCIQPLSQHLDQLSARDCATLSQICLEWLNQPNPQMALLAAEQRWMRTSLAALRDQVKQGDVAGAAKQLGLSDETLKEYQAFIPKDPAQVDVLFNQAIQRFEEHLQKVVAELQKPAWERKLPGELKPEDAGGYLASFLIPSYSLVNNRFTREQAQIQLLACHAAIRRYKWEHDRLPGSLEELRLGNLALDPYTGSPLRYQVKGQRYSLTAAGVEAQNSDDPQAVGGRVPVGLTPDD